jgi:hypothetical protein
MDLRCYPLPEIRVESPRYLDQRFPISVSSADERRCSNLWTETLIRVGGPSRERGQPRCVFEYTSGERFSQITHARISFCIRESVFVPIPEREVDVTPVSRMFERGITERRPLQTPHPASLSTRRFLLEQYYESSKERFWKQVRTTIENYQDRFPQLETRFETLICSNRSSRNSV